MGLSSPGSRSHVVPPLAVNTICGPDGVRLEPYRRLGFTGSTAMMPKPPLSPPVLSMRCQVPEPVPENLKTWSPLLPVHCPACKKKVGVPPEMATWTPQALAGLED